MKRILVICSIFLAQSVARADEPDWQSAIDSDGVKVWTRDRLASRFKEARGEIEVQASAKKVFSVIIAAETCREWVFSCVDSYVISRPEPQDGIVYMRTNSLWPIADRDVVFLAKTSFDAVKQEYRAELSHKSDTLPPVTGVVRIEAMTGRWVVTALDENRSRVVFWSHVEPGGLLPAALVNFTLGRLHEKSLLKLRDFVSRGT